MVCPFEGRRAAPALRWVTGEDHEILIDPWEFGAPAKPDGTCVTSNVQPRPGASKDEGDVRDAAPGEDGRCRAAQ